MKKIIFISLVALAAFVSCLREDASDSQSLSPNAPQIVTASIDQGGTKVTLDIGETKAKVNWDEDDFITVTDKNGKLAIYTVKTGAGTSDATFEIAEYLDGFGEAPFTAEYGVDLSKMGVQQPYYPTSSNKSLYMTAPESSTANFTFAVQQGLIKFHLKDPEHFVKHILFEGEKGLAAEMEAETPVDISEGKDFYIALAPGKYTKLTIEDDEEFIAEKTIDFDIAKNQVRSAKSSDLKFVPKPDPESYVQLWEGGPYWATENLGSRQFDIYKPEYYCLDPLVQFYPEHGHMYAWGYTEGCDYYDNNWHSAINGEIRTFGHEFHPGDYPQITGELYRRFKDAATFNLGYKWRMPTREEFATLINEDGSNRVTTAPGVGTFVFQGNTDGYRDKSIELPVTGYGEDDRQRDPDSSEQCNNKGVRL